MPASPQEADCTIHEATLASGPRGTVVAGGEITFEVAVERRANGLNVVVCGQDQLTNKRMARQIEAAVGTASAPQHPHTGTCRTSSWPVADVIKPGKPRQLRNFDCAGRRKS